MAYRETLHCDEQTCPDTFDLSEGTPGGPAWVTVALPLEAHQHFNPMTMQLEWHRPIQTKHFSRARCLALWACGLADELLAQEQAAAAAQRDAVGASEWTTPQGQWQALRAARLAKGRTAREREQYDRLRAWTEGDEGSA